MRRRYRRAPARRRRFLRPRQGGTLARMYRGSRQLAAPGYAAPRLQPRVFKYIDTRSDIGMNYQLKSALGTIIPLDCSPGTLGPGIIVGNGLMERTSRKIANVFTELMFSCIYNPDLTFAAKNITGLPIVAPPRSFYSSATLDCSVHVALVCDLQPNGLVPLIAEIWNDSQGTLYPDGATAPINLATRDRFRVIWRRRLRLDPSSGELIIELDPTTNQIISCPRTSTSLDPLITARISMPYNTTYKTGTSASPGSTGALTDISKGAYYLVHDAVPDFFIKWRTRHCFLDL